MAQLPLEITSYLQGHPAELAAVVCAVAFCVVAVAYDLRQRRIPNLLNLLALLAAASFTALAGKIGFTFVLFIAFSFLFAYLLYKLGVWAGGDAKFFTALLAFLPIFKGNRFELIALVFLASAALTLPVLAFLHWRKMLSLRSEFLEIAASSPKPALFGAITSTAIYLLASLLLSSPVQDLPLGFAVSFAFIFATSFFVKSFSIVSEKILRNTVAVSSLKEGDIPAQSVFLKSGKPAYWQPPSPRGLLKAVLKLDAASISQSMPPGNEIVSCLRARGISVEEIRQLKKFGVTQLAVKQSVPFTPALALGFILAAWLA